MTMESGKRIRINIVGDSLIFRNGLRVLIETVSAFKVVCEAASVSEMRGLIQTSTPDVILINSSEVTKDDAKEFLSEFCKDISTLVLTNDDDPKTHQKYLLMGANGVITKQQGSDILFKAIRQVYSQELWFKRDVMRQTIEQLVREKETASSRSYVDKCAALSEREKEVLTSICKGMKNREIAENLFITETTVRHHLTSIFEKLKVKSRLALAIYAFNEGLVEVPPIDKSLANLRS